MSGWRSCIPGPRGCPVVKLGALSLGAYHLRRPVRQPPAPRLPAPPWLPVSSPTDALERPTPQATHLHACLCRTAGLPHHPLPGPVPTTPLPPQLRCLLLHPLVTHPLRCVGLDLRAVQCPSFTSPACWHNASTCTNRPDSASTYPCGSRRWPESGVAPCRCPRWAMRREDAAVAVEQHLESSSVDDTAARHVVPARSSGDLRPNWSTTSDIVGRWSSSHSCNGATAGRVRREGRF